MTKVVIIGAGKGGRALLEMFVGDATVSILGVADVNPWAPGIEFARRFNIPVTTDLREFVTDPRADLIIDVTGSPDVHQTILRSKPAGAEVMGGLSARFVWDLLAERKRSEELEDRYSLVVRELQAQEGDFIIGQNLKMREVAELVARVAPAPTTVLVRGESGTGKELVARAIHKYSPLRDKPLLTVNCTALTPSLMESELFGHRRGAFTGAIADKVGLFEKADGGTIFLDEIGDVSPALQAKLLRVLQEHQIRPVGGSMWRAVDVRAIAATNRDLASAVEQGRFREDLYYRLKVVTLQLPPLRERREDVPLLVDHLVRRAARECRKTVTGVSEHALEWLRGYHWPGNVRELAHVLERGVALAQQEVLTAEDLPEELRRPGPAAARATPDDRPTLAELKRRYVHRVFEESGGNVSRAAQVLGVDRRSLYRMLQRYGVTPRGGAQE